MIQRIQSIFLLLAAVCLLVLFSSSKPLSFISVFGDVSALNQVDQAMLADGIFNIQDHIVLIVMVGLGGLLAFASIFLFKNRPLQITLARVTLVMSILILVLAGVFFYQDYVRLNASDYLFEVEFGVLGPIFAIIFAILAIRFIKKDDKLVKSMDRLR